MILEVNNYYNLAISQLFPFNASINDQIPDNDALKLAKEAYEFILNENYSAAISTYTKAIAIFPDQPFFYACRSILHSFNADDESSYYDYQVAKRKDFNYHHYLEWLENEGQMEVAEELVELNQAVISQPENSQLFINRAMLQVQHFNYSNAIADYSKAFVLNNDYKILISRAAVYMYILQYDKALEDLNLVIDTEPVVEAYLYRAKLFMAIKEFDFALQDFDAALILDPQNNSVLEERGQLFEQLEEFDKAIKDYSSIIKSNTEDFYPYVLRADVYEKTENWSNAIADYSEAIRLNPYYSDLYQYRGALLEKIGDTISSAADYAKFEELEEED